MSTSIPFGRRRLVVTLAAEPLRAKRGVVDVTVEASDAELARLATSKTDARQAVWDAWAALHVGRW